MIGKAHIQRANPADGVAWICYLDSGGRGLGPHGFGDTQAEAYSNWLFDLQHDIGPHCDTARLQRGAQAMRRREGGRVRG